MEDEPGGTMQLHMDASSGHLLTHPLDRCPGWSTYNSFAQSEAEFHASGGDWAVKPISERRMGRAGKVTILVKLDTQRRGGSRGESQPKRILVHPLDSISQLKELVEAATGVSVGQQRLSVKGRLMRELRSGVEQTLTDYAVVGGTLLVLRVGADEYRRKPQQRQWSSIARGSGGANLAGARLVLSSQDATCADTTSGTHE